jgi:DNA end-binding protein Ku
MPRPIWNGSISFGLVNIPVKIYNATQKKALHFHQLRASDGCRIRLRRICENDEQEVANEEIVKGYELSSDRYVVVSEQELQNLNPKTSRSIDIEDFVELQQIDPLYYERSYYLFPDKGAAKAYKLLLTAMQTAKKTAIARIVLRNKQHLAAIRPAGNVLTLSTMFFAEEIVALDTIEGLPGEDISPTERELDMAEQLIKSLTATFNPQKYHDEYRAKILEMIENKAEGQQAVVSPEAEKGKGKVIDLMAALEASIASVKKQESPNKTRRKKTRAQ